MLKSLTTNLFYKDLVGFSDVFPEAISCELPNDKGTRNEIELKPGSKNCIMKQWPLPRKQVLAFDKFVIDRLKASHIMESTSRQSSPTFCVRKVTSG